MIHRSSFFTQHWILCYLGHHHLFSYYKFHGQGGSMKWPVSSPQLTNEPSSSSTWAQQSFVTIIGPLLLHSLFTNLTHNYLDLLYSMLISRFLLFLACINFSIVLLHVLQFMSSQCKDASLLTKYMNAMLLVDIFDPSIFQNFLLACPIIINTS